MFVEVQSIWRMFVTDQRRKTNHPKAEKMEKTEKVEKENQKVEKMEKKRNESKGRTGKDGKRKRKRLNLAISSLKPKMVAEC